MRMKDKVALVSGAAGGMGAATARLFAREGAKAVVVADLLDKEGEAVVADIKKAGGTATYMHLDVTDEAQWKSVVDKTVAAHGGLNVLVNNAGISGSAEQDLYDTAAWNRLMGVNATGVFLGMKYGIAAMKKAGNGGSVINLSSISGIVGQGYIHVGYNASKGAVRLITKAAAAEHGRDRIRVNSVHPGLMPPMRTSGRTADPETRAKTLKGVPMGRAGEVDEVAYAILFLASDEILLRHGRGDRGRRRLDRGLMADPKKPATTIAPWQVLELKYSYRDRWLAVRSDTVRVPNGTILSPYHTIEFPEWICAIALTPEREIVLIEEYRHGIERNSFELPCGTPDHEGESVLDATKRELREETGYAADEWHALGSSTANTARQNNRVHAFLALDARKVAEPELDAGEVISTHLVPWERFLADLADGRLEIPGLHLAALWQLKVFAKQTRDPRLLALGL